MSTEPGFYLAIDSIGGGTGAIDKLKGAPLQDKEAILAFIGTEFRPYHLDADSGIAENDPLAIKPDEDAGDKRWILSKGVFAGLTLYGNITMPNDGTMGQAAGPLLTFDDDNNHLHISGCKVGIGNIVFTPNEMLHVYSSNTHARLEIESATDNASLIINAPADEVAYMSFETLSVEDWSIKRDAGSNDLGVYSVDIGAYAMLWKANGDVGIGLNTAPTVRLEITKAGLNSQTKQMVSTFNDQTGYYCSIFMFRKSHSDTLGTLVETIDNEVLGRMEFRGVNNVSIDVYGVEIDVIQDGAAGAFVPCNMILNTHSSTAKNTNQLVLYHDGGIYMHTLKSGTDQANAGAAANEIYHDTDDHTIKIGV